MALPTSTQWDLIHFDESNVDTLLTGYPGDITYDSSYFAYGEADKAVLVVSADGTEATATFNVPPLGGIYSWEIDIQTPSLPKTLAMGAGSRFGISFVNGDGDGAALAFSELGIGVGAANKLDTLSPLPDTLGVATGLRTTYYTIRIAVDTAQDRVYIYMNPVWQSPTIPQFVIPLPDSVAASTFSIFAQGHPSDVVGAKIRGVRLASTLQTLQLQPQANPGPDRVLSVGQTVRFDGRGSGDPEDDTLTYRWSLKEVPIGSAYGHVGVASTVDDGDADGVTTVLNVVPYSMPNWVQAGDSVRIGTLPPLTVDEVDHYLGTLTVLEDVIPDNYTEEYFQIFRQTFFLTTNESTAVALPDVQGIYRVDLIVNDGYQDSTPVDVIANVVGSRAPLGTEPRVESIWQAIGNEWNLLEGKEFFTESWRASAQILSGKLLEAWQFHYNYSITDVQDTFQKKWVSYRTFTAESAPDKATYKPKFGRVVTEVSVLAPITGLTGKTIEFEYYDGATPQTIDVTFTGDSAVSIITDLDTAFSGIPADASLIPVSSKVLIDSPDAAIRVVGGTALELLGLAVNQANTVSGSDGEYVSDYVYRVEYGVDLRYYSIEENDLLVLNGEGYRIAKVITDTTTPQYNQRFLLKDPITRDVPDTWEVSGVLQSDKINFAEEAIFSGDLLQFEAYEIATGEITFLTGYVRGYYGNICAADLHDIAGVVDNDEYDLTFLGVKRRKSLVLPDNVVSVPKLQDTIPVSSEPTSWRENLHYIIETIYRREGGSPSKVLMFRDSVFIDKNIEPPDVFWAEYTYLDNGDNIEGRFGRLAGLSQDEFANVSNSDDVSYRSAVSGLMYSQQRGPILDTIRIGAQVLFGQPFADVSGTITDVQPNYSTTHGRMIVQDELDEESSRTYKYRKDEDLLTPESGLDINPRTGAPWAVGDMIEKFEPIGAGVTIADYVSDPTWYQPRVRGGFSELEKIHSFAVEAQTSLVSFAQLDTLIRFIRKVRPSHKDFVISAVDTHEDDIDIELDKEWTINYKQYSSPVRSNRFMVDHYRGDGTNWYPTDGSANADEYLDTVVDLLSLNLDLTWPGGAFSEAAFFPEGVNAGENGYDLIDIDGNYGAPGGTVTPTYNDPLIAGDYRAVIDIKTTGLVLP